MPRATVSLRWLEAIHLQLICSINQITLVCLYTKEPHHLEILKQQVDYLTAIKNGVDMILKHPADYA